MTAVGIYTYDAQDLEIAIGEQIMEGWGESDFISMAFTGDTFEEKVGADGLAYRSRDRTGTTFVKCTLTLMAASPVNSYLTALYRIDTLSNEQKKVGGAMAESMKGWGLTGVGTFPMSVKFKPFATDSSVGGRYILNSVNAFIKTLPEVKGGKSIGTYEWTIMATAYGAGEYFHPHGMYYGEQETSLFSTISGILRF
jgi:hypothetical protein